MKNKLLNYKNMVVEIGILGHGSESIVHGKIKDVVRHGYNTNYGGWSLYPLCTSEKEPAYFLVFKKEKQKKSSIYNINQIKYVKKLDRL